MYILSMNEVKTLIYAFFPGKVLEFGRAQLEIFGQF